MHASKAARVMMRDEKIYEHGREPILPRPAGSAADVTFSGHDFRTSAE